jgi:hypothetical protein
VYSDKYNRIFSQEEINASVQRLTNQMWKLIPMREHQEDWQKQLKTVIIEVAGLNEIFMSPNLLQLLSKLEGLAIIETTFEQYRKTVFECISLIRGVK